MSGRWKIKRTIIRLESDRTLVDDIVTKTVGPEEGFETQKDALKYIVEHNFVIATVDNLKKEIWLRPIEKR
ncbi:MAG: hypothetical protein J7J44_08800 [Deltaproteobacteria bacterium]|nr:hypothetical protein [Deltaproteobacteria bacterium]